MSEWITTNLTDIGVAIVFVQDHGWWPEIMKIKGFFAFKIWVDEMWVTFAQPIGKRDVRYVPRSGLVTAALKTWRNTYIKEKDVTDTND